MEDDPINSSDQEFEARPNPFTNVGSRVIEDLLDNAFEDRMESKKFSKQLNRNDGAPGTRRLRNRWEVYFLSFYSQTLQKNIETTMPTSQDIERFLPVIVKYIRGYGENGAPGYAYIRGGLKHLIVCLQFRFAKFSLIKHERLRIASVVNELLDSGKITKNSTHEKHWITAQLIDKLTRSVFEQALTKGTLSWDVVISKCLSLVLQSAIAGRAGEVMRSQDYEEVICLRYEHVNMKVVSLAAENWRLEALINVNYEKGVKRDNKINKKVRIDSLDDSELNTCCALKLLIILALRTGAVSGTSLNEVLVAARSRNNRRIIWSHPEWPVISKIHGTGRELSVGLSAGVNQMRGNLQFAANAASLLHDLRPHDIRHGSALDFSSLPPALRGVATDSVQVGLGHSSESRKRGHTQKYTGYIRDTTWEKRLALEAEDFELDFGQTPYNKKRRLSKDEITKICQDNKWDSDLSKNRRKASKLALDLDLKKWRELERGTNSPAAAVEEPKALHNLTPNERNVNQQQKRKPARRRNPISTTTKISENGILDVEALDPRLFDKSTKENISPSPTPFGDTSRDSTEDLSDLEDMISPVTTSDDMSLPTISFDDTFEEDNIEVLEVGGVVASISELIQGQDISDETIELLYEAQLRNSPSNVTGILDVGPTEFITFFAKTNVIRISGAIKKHLKKAIRGESREEPTPFEFRCPHHRLGCESTVNCDESLRVHLKTCPTTAEEHASRRNKPFPCTEILDDGTICSRSFNGDPQLKRHIRHDHKGLSLWENRRCAEGKCNGTIIYKTQSEWTHHRRNSHSGFKPMHCPMRDCKGSKLFDKEKELLRHMEKLHFMTHEQRVAALPYKQEEKAKEAVIQDEWDQRKCPHPDCPSTTMFTNRTALLSHLKVKHDLKKSSSPKEFKLYLGAEWPPGNDSSSESGSD